MKQPPLCETPLGLRIGRLWCAVVAGFGVQLDPSWAASNDRTLADDLFHTNLPRVSIEISEEGIQSLRGSRTTRSPQTKSQSRATVSEDGRLYTNVTVQLKGFTSFQPIDRFPGLTLNFNKLAPGQKFRGFAKVSLNNSLQDGTFLNEKFSREMFAAADVPVPRADYALVTLNGRDLGLYVATEGFDKEFLKRHFKRTDGNLYEAGVLQDIDRTLKVNSGGSPTNHAGILRLLRASQEPDPGKRYRALEAAVDMERFLSMVAMETMLCHSDSYSMNRNNYRLYHDPATDKMVFMPHGMDRVLGTHRSSLDLPLVPPTLGLVARAVLSTPEGRRRYIERAGVLFTNLFDTDRLCHRIHELEERILAAKLNLPLDRRFSDRPGKNQARDADKVCSRVAERSAEIKTQLAYHAELLAPTWCPRFDADGVAAVDEWKPRRTVSQSQVRCEAQVRDEKSILRLSTPNETSVLSLHSRVSLPAGVYQLTGCINAAGASPGSISASLLRYSTERFGVARQHLDWRAMEFEFEVAESNAPQEIEFVCEMRSDSYEVWFDASSLRLVGQRK